MLMTPLKRIYRLRRTRLTGTPLILRPQLGWRFRVARVVLLLVLAFALVGVGAYFGWHEARMYERAKMTSQLERAVESESLLEQERSARRSAEQQLTMERATRETLAKDLSKVQAELASRQRALVFLDSLLTANDRSREVRFVACELRNIEKNRYRYSALVAQGLNRAAEFSGRLLLNVDYAHGAQRGRLTLGKDTAIPLVFKHYERAEGEVVIPLEHVPTSMEIRVLSSDGRKVVAQCQKKLGAV